MTQPETYLNTVTLHEQSLFQLVSIYNNEKDSTELFNSTLQHLIDVSHVGLSENYPLVFLQGRIINPGPDQSEYLFDTYESNPKLTTLRVDEYMSFNLASDDGKVEFISSYSTKKQSQLEAIMGISRTTFVCLVLSVSSIFFTKDAQVLVLDPLERMIEKVRLIAQNPLYAANEDLDKMIFWSEANLEQKGEDHEEK